MGRRCRPRRGLLIGDLFPRLLRDLIMKRSCLFVLSALIVGLTHQPLHVASSEPAAPVAAAPGPSLPCTPGMIEVPEKRLQVVYHKVKVRQPVTQTVLVP